MRYNAPDLLDGHNLGNETKNVYKEFLAAVERYHTESSVENSYEAKRLYSWVREDIKCARSCHWISDGEAADLLESISL